MGAPLWDGKAKLRARMALPDESTVFAEAKNNDQMSDGLMLVYLIELDGEELPSIRAPFRRPGRCLSGHQRPGRGRPTRCCMLSSCSASSHKASAQAICANSSRLCPAAIRNRSRKVPSPANCAGFGPEGESLAPGSIWVSRRTAARYNNSRNSINCAVRIRAEDKENKILLTAGKC
jgi:hypothetical protein